MKEEGVMTRRNFVASATLGAAATGFRLPSELLAAERGVGLDAAGETPLLRLHRNESPYGLPPAAAEAIRGAVGGMSPRYPIDEPTALAGALAKRFGVDREQVALGCGSIEVLRMATETFCGPSRAAIVAEPTYEAVVSYCPFVHSRAVKIPLTRRDYRHDLPRMLGAASQGAGMIFFCNPSNPAGTVIGKREVERFVRKLPRGVVLLADEAYFDYVEGSEHESCLRYVKEGLPVVVSRTFSKIYGMAGLRVGYAIGRKDLIKRMLNRRLANNPNQLAVAAALAGLKDDEFVARARRRNAEARDYLCGELGGMGLAYIPSATNFVTISLNRPAKPLIEALKGRRVLVGREFPSIPRHMRVTLGTVEEMKLFVKVFKDVLNLNHA